MRVGAKTVATSALISLIVLVLAEEHRSSGLPTTQQFIAYGFVFLILSMFWDLGFDAAGAFALLAMVAIVLEQGEDALAFVGARAGLPSKPRGHSR